MIDTAIRSQGIGASEIAAIVGLHPNMSAFDVWAQKSGLLEQVIAETNSRMAWGKRLERAIADGYQEITGTALEWLDTTLPGSAEYQVYTPDAVNRNLRLGVDCKNVGFDQISNFGEPGTDEVPDHINTQCHWSIDASNYDRWDVAVLAGGNDLRIYTVLRDEELEGMLREQGQKFWRDHVMTGVPPAIEDTERAREYLAKRYPKNNGQLHVPTGEEAVLIADYARARKALAAAGKVKGDLEMQIKQAIADSDGFLLPGKERLTYKQSKGTTETDWQSLALGLKGKIDADAWALLLAMHTKPKPGVRRIYAKFED